jgi:prepilin-type N-terminal cleavage/methylation domain-containing protein
MLTNTLKHQSNKSGMTLVEIMMALLIFSLVMIVLINFWMDGMIKVTQGQEQADNLQAVRLTLSHFEKDVREATQVVHYIDDVEQTTLILKKKVGYMDDPKDQFVIWTYYKKTIELGNHGKLDGALCRDTFDEEPTTDTRALDPQIMAFTKSKTGNRVGIYHEADDTDGNRVHSYLYAYNIYYDPGYQDKDFLTSTDKDNMAARARFRNADSSTWGFDKVEDIVAIEIRFLINDDRNNVKLYRDVIYIRSLFYQKVYDQ